MNRHKTAFFWGLRGLIGCTTGYVLFVSVSAVGSVWPAYLAHVVAPALLGLFWGLFLDSWKLAIGGAAACVLVLIAANDVGMPLAGRFLDNATSSSSGVWVAVQVGLLLGLGWYCTGLGAGALLGQMAGKKRLRASGARLGARVGLYTPLPLWIETAYTGQLAAHAISETAALVTMMTLTAGLTLFAATLGRDKAAQAALEQNT